MGCGSAFDGAPAHVVDDAAAEAGTPPAPIVDAGQEAEPDAAGERPSDLEAGRPGDSSASDETVDAGPGSDAAKRTCLVVTPGYGCPPGFPYVPRDAGPEPMCCDAP